MTGAAGSGAWTMPSRSRLSGEFARAPLVRTGLPWACAAWLLAAALAAAEPRSLAEHLADLSASEAGFALLDDGRAEEAEAHFRAVLAGNSTSCAARVGLARAVFRSVRWGEVLDGLEAARPGRGADPAAWAALLDRVPDHSDREALMAALAAHDPHNPLAAVARARAALGPQATGYRGVWSGGYDFTMPFRDEQPELAAARAHIAPFLVARPGALFVWHFLLESISCGSAEDRAAAARAVEADPRSPLAPRVRLDLASWTSDGPERLAALAAIEADDPEGPYSDDARVQRAQMMRRRDPDGATALLESVAIRPHGNARGGALSTLAGLHLEAGRYEAAIEAVRRFEELGGTDERVAVRALIGLGRFEEAERRCLDRIARNEQSGVSATQSETLVRESRWYLGEICLASGRAREAIDLFDRVEKEAPPGQYGPHREPGASRLQRDALVGAFPFPIAAAVLHLFLLGLTGAAAGVVLAARWDRVRRLWAPAAALAALTTALQMGAATAAGTGSASDLGYLLLMLMHNFALAGAGAALLPAVGVKHGPWARLLVRGARRRWSAWPRALGRLALAWLALAAWTAAMIAMAQPRVGPFFERMGRLFRGSEHSILMGLDGDRGSMLLLALSAALREELVYRYALLGLFLWAGLRLAGRSAPARRAVSALSVLAVAILWAIVHAGMVEPEWFKIAQVSGLGVVLGWLTLKQGPGSAVVAHASFNGLSILLMG